MKAWGEGNFLNLNYKSILWPLTTNISELNKVQHNKSTRCQLELFHSYYLGERVDSLTCCFEIVEPDEMLFD